ncbi:3'-5' exoribonuclease YhaM family protein [bacterium]
MYLVDLVEGQEFELPIFVVSVIEKTTKSGKNYITGEVRDKSTVLKYNLWDAKNPSISIPKQGEYALISGRLEVFNNTYQINLRTVKSLDAESINPDDFKKTIILDIDELWKEFESIVATFTDDLIIFLCENILTESFVEKFKTSPAAKDVHSACVGGLLEHSVAVAKLSDMVVNHYNKLYFNNKINRDITVFSSLFHDLGKIWEYDYTTPNIEITMHGELLGHIYLGAKKIGDIAQLYRKHKPDVDLLELNEKINRILHVILAHHGKGEWGAPVTPKTPEAIIIHYVDNIDAKLMNVWENLMNCQDYFTQRNFIHENARLFNILKD